MSWDQLQDMAIDPQGLYRQLPIAIIGIGCRFPGGVNGPEAFWQLLQNQIDAIREVPPDRFDINALYDPLPGTPGKIMTRYGGFLDQVTQFDAAFFGISPREADSLDPQQRLLLELAWESLANAGQVVPQLNKSQTGVFLGLWHTDYQSLLFADPAALDFYSTIGSEHYSASGRISYMFGFQGPSITVNTHCSSSLVAVHLACQSLWRGECVLALAGGANLILRPHISIAYSQSQMLAPDGHCKFGDARADGYVRSEGAGMVVLKPLAQAMADGDPIYAVIRGSAVANEGRSSGFLATPGRQGQEGLLRRAYQDAGILPSRVQYVEAHGTGTKVGDVVELQALGAVLGNGRSPQTPCFVGSVKTNLGHTEAAAGIAGLIKVALMLQHRTIPASLHLQTLNPQLPWAELPLTIPTQATPWPEDVATAVAGVSSFGIAGTNAHVVLSEWRLPRQTHTPPRPLSSVEADKAYLLPLSAPTAQELTAVVQSYQEFLATPGCPPIEHICYTAACRRTHLPSRLAVVGSNPTDLIAHLEGFLRGETAVPDFDLDFLPGLLDTDRNVNQPLPTDDAQSQDPFAPDQTTHRPKLAFVFSGQGSQWVGMGRQLMQQEPVFRHTLEQCQAAMQPFVEWQLLDQLLTDADSPNFRLHDIDVIQPTLASVQIALAALWRSWGIVPDAVIGHSMGEVSAAYVAGALTLPDAMHIICRRSQLMHRHSGQGAMAVVELSAAEMQSILADDSTAGDAVSSIAHLLSIASINSPRSLVLSGDPTALDVVLAQLQQQNIFCRKIKVDVASHSPQMDDAKQQLQQELAGLQPQAGSIAIYSTTLGRVTDGSVCTAAYWGQNLRQPTLFSNMVQQLLADGYGIFIEITPHPILAPAIEQGLTFAGQSGLTLTSLRRADTEHTVLLDSLAVLYQLGYPVHWSALYPAGGGQMVSLPLYPWQRQRFWFTPEAETTTPDTASPAMTASPSASPNPMAPPKPQPFPIREMLRTAVSGADHAHRQSLLEAHLREQVAQVLHLPPSRVPLNRPLKTLGLDSLGTVEFIKRLETSLGLSLSATLVWNYPTLMELVAYLVGKIDTSLHGTEKEELIPAVQLTPPSAVEDVIVLPDNLTAQLDDISLDEVETLLRAELEAIDNLLKRV